MLGMVATAGVVAAPAATAAPATVHTADFEQDTAGWAGRGTAQLAPSTAQARSGAQSLAVTGRTDTWHGPGLDAAALLPAGSWEVEAWVRLADTTPEPETDVVTLSAARTPTGGATAYDTVAWQVAVSDSAWTRVAGTYEFGTSNSGLELYLESPDATQAFFVDDVTITGEPAAPVEPGTRADLATDFESGTGGWTGRGEAQVATTTSDAHGGTTSLLTTGRTQGWHGPAVDVTDGLALGETVQVSVWAKLASGQAPASLRVSVQRERGTAMNYDNVAGASAVVTADAWTELRGTYTLGAAIDRAQLYVEGDAGVDFLIDDFALAGFAETPLQDVPGLADVLGADGFEHVGVAIDQRETVGRPAQLVQRHFDALTPENDGKPAEVQPTEGTFTFGDLDALLDFADATGTDVYGHVLVWHSQTPDWFFLDGDRPLTNAPADQALLRARMEAHIKGIADHLAARYPDGDSPIWAMDVVNEVIADGDNANPHDMRDSRWFQVLGEGFVDEAFRLADRYFPDTALFINDYNTEMPAKRADYLELVSALVERGVPIDGVGHQAHVDFARPVQWLDDSLTAVEQLSARTGTPLLQAITELDVSDSKENNGADVSNGTVPQHSPAMADQDAAETELGYYYRDLFDMLRGHSDSIEAVTFWGISNGRSWLRTWPAARPWESPLPFDDDLQVMPAYWGIVDPTQLAPRPADVLPPRIAAQDPVRATATSTAGALVRYPLPQAGDTRDGRVTPTCSPRPWTVFPIGTTQVSCTATDSAGNRSNPVTFDVVVTAPPTGTRLYQQINNGPVVRANVKQTVQLVVQFGNRGTGVLLGDSFGYACTQTSGPAMTLELAPGSARQVANRDYPAGQNGNVSLRARPTETGAAAFDCTLSMTDSRGAAVSATTSVTIDVRR
ncbi:endo-1,4-beta-xylanase [uncultured Modestobacter sp.]|uniref:endo-1,4-beta-xylanase n=1 Tax=uncultured Modestobacter sp. TaxID=380048 RepID=UPI002626E52C|nr:endo-1,4-beta-xylanase [uncultured Modestobacter sp.]